MSKSEEAMKFDAAMTKVLSVSHDELKRREEGWKKQRKAKKLAKADNRAKGR